jgi:hypothetical protein
MDEVGYYTVEGLAIMVTFVLTFSANSGWRQRYSPKSAFDC